MKRKNKQNEISDSEVVKTSKKSKTEGEICQFFKYSY